MRNLKKILALVLALVMSLSLVTVANAAYVDGKLDTDEDVNENYDEAVTVLKDMGIFQGYNGGESFEPQKNITRAEVATLLYRIVTADVDGEQANLYVDGAKFTDLTGYGWAQGYIGYCANGGIAKGRNATTFAPGDEITGYEVLAMILRAIGYDKNGEFTGANWSNNVAKIAQELGILANVDAASAQLSKPATRELVAELLFSTMTKADMVEYTTAFGYQSINNDVEKYLGTLGWKNFYLWSYDDADMDYFGRPGWYWIWGDAYYRETNTWVNPHYSNFLYVPAAEYTTAVTECDVAHDMGWSRNTNVLLTVNGEENTYYTVEAKDTVGLLGAQGRLTEVYEYYDFDGNLCREIVMIDTYLAEVTKVTPAVKDAAGHVAVPAKTTLRVWDNSTSKYIDITMDYDAGYEVGTYVLVQSYCTSDNTAITAGTLAKDNRGYYYIDILGEAEGITGKQTVINYFVDGHTVDGVYYNDANTLVLDEAAYDTAAHVWYFDTYGNIIGIVDIPDTYHYGVIESIQWYTQAGDYGYAWATIKTMDGGSITGAVAKFNGMAMTKELSGAQGNPASATVSTELVNNHDYVGQHLYQITVDGNDMLVLNEIGTGSPVIGANLTTAGTLSSGKHYALDSTKVVDENTVYLYGYYDVYGRYTTVSYTGFNNITKINYTEIDWIDTNGDNRIDYVYVIGTDVDSTYAALFYMTNKSAVYTIGDYVVVNGVLNGTQQDVSFTLNAYNDMKNKFDNVGTGHVLFAVGVKNGAVNYVDTNKVNKDISVTSDLNSTYAWSGTQKGYTSITEVTGTDSDKYAGKVLTLGTTSYNVTNATTVIYATKQGTVETELVEGAKYTDYHFTVVYDNMSKDALYIYIFDSLTNGVFAPVSYTSWTANWNAISKQLVVTNYINGTEQNATEDLHVYVAVKDLLTNENETVTSYGYKKMAEDTDSSVKYSNGDEFTLTTGHRYTITVTVTDTAGTVKYSTSLTTGII